jgi:hypothetical protein
MMETAYFLSLCRPESFSTGLTESCLDLPADDEGGFVAEISTPKKTLRAMSPPRGSASRVFYLQNHGRVGPALH